MREIKFRVWDGKLGQFIRLCETNLLPNNVIGSYLSSVIVMQYTGLKDKNGVEIYEGDIISVDIAYNCDFEYKRPDTVINHKVKTVNMEASFSGGCFHLKSDKIPEDEDMLWIWCNDAEVIGNIYENPELIPK